MQIRPGAVVFTYDSFPEVPEEQWEGSELKHAYALCLFIAEHFRTFGFSAQQPVQEDFGAVLPVKGPAGAVDIFVSFYPREINEDFSWAVQFSEGKGIFRALLGSGDNESVLAPVKDCLARIIESRTDLFRNCVWMEPSKL